MTEEKITDVINDFFGVDAMYYGVDTKEIIDYICYFFFCHNYLFLSGALDF